MGMQQSKSQRTLWPSSWHVQRYSMRSADVYLISSKNVITDSRSNAKVATHHPYEEISNKQSSPRML